MAVAGRPMAQQEKSPRETLDEPAALSKPILPDPAAVFGVVFGDRQPQAVPVSLVEK